MAFLQVPWHLRDSAQSQLEAPWPLRDSTDLFEFPENLRDSASLGMEVTVSLRDLAPTQQAVDYFYSPPPPTVGPYVPRPANLAAVGPVRPVSSVVIGGVDVTEYLIQLEIQEVLGGQASFAARFRDRDKWFPRWPSRFNPLYTWGTDEFAGKIRPHNWTLGNPVTIQITVAGMTWTSCPFVLSAPEFDGQDLDLKGLEPTVLLEEEIQGTADILSDRDPPDQVFAHSFIRDSLATKGITCNFLFPDYRIRELKRGKGQVWTQIQQVLRPYQALVGRWRAGNLVLGPAPKLANMSPDFYLTHEQIETFNLQFNEAMKTGVKVSRLVPQAGQIGEANCSGGQCVGIQTASVTPSRIIRAEVQQVESGGIANVTFFQGETVAGVDLGDQNSIFYQGSLLADKVQFSYLPTFQGSGLGGGTVGSFTPSYRIVFWGGTGNGGGLDSSFTGEYNDLVTEGVFRKQRESSAIEDPVVPDGTVAQHYAEAYVHENTRQAWKLPFGTPFLNPAWELASCVGIYHPGSSQVNQKWLIQERRMIVQAGATGAGLHGYMNGLLTKRVDD